MYKNKIFRRLLKSLGPMLIRANVIFSHPFSYEIELHSLHTPQSAQTHFISYSSYENQI